MCGIVAAVATRDVVPILIEGLQRLEYRGYDSAGVAVINGKTQADVQARVNAVLAGSRINVGTVTPSPSNWATAPGGTAVTVTLSVNYSSVSWLPTPRFLRNKTVSASATMNSERP